MKDLTLEQCFDRIRKLVDYNFIKNQKEYANHLFEVAKNDKNLKLWIDSYYKMQDVFKKKHPINEDLDNLLWNNYQLGFFYGFNMGLGQVARGILESLEKLK
ncbi:hypothetical protein KAX08_05565 [candidate division WOR-3 bacterium]|nr:hypothetical protein [candidate division WOR-3 bacterium]